MRRGEGSGQSRMGRNRRDKNAADNPVESEMILRKALPILLPPRDQT